MGGTETNYENDRNELQMLVCFCCGGITLFDKMVGQTQDENGYFTILYQLLS
jgi:hypothetical protein